MMRSLLAPLKGTLRMSQNLTPAQRETLDFAEEYWKRGREAREPFERRWYVNMAMTCGHQWLAWNDTTQSLYVPPEPRYRHRITANRIQPLVLNTVSILSSRKPTYRVKPKTTRDEDLGRARVSLKVFLDIHQRAKMDRKNLLLLTWMAVYGTSFKDHFMNYRKGQRVRAPKGVSESGDMTFYDFRTGEVDCRIRSPFQIVPESGALDIESSTRIGIEHPMSCEQIAEQWVDGQFVQPEYTHVMSSMEQQLKGMMKTKIGLETPTPMTSQVEGYATVKELRELPTKAFPEGRHIFFANGVLLYAGELPYEYMKVRRSLGITRYVYIETGECFWGRTPITDAIPLQVSLNHTYSQIEEIKNLTAKPKWIAFREHKLPQSAFNSEVEVLEPTYYPGVPEPHPIEPPQIPVYMREWPGVLTESIEHSSLIHRVSQGQGQSHRSSGVETQYLQEKDLQVFAPVMTLFEQSEAESGTIALEIAKERYHEDRLLEIVGPEGEIEILAFRTPDQDMPTSVVVEAGTALPESLIARRQMVIQLADGGNLGDMNDPWNRRHFLKMLEFGDVDKIFEEETADERHAEREHRLWINGEFEKVFVYEFDNDKVHIIRHDLFRKSDSYRDLIERVRPIPGMQDRLLSKAKLALPMADGVEDENELAEIWLSNMTTTEQLMHLGAEGVIDRHVRQHMDFDPEHQAMKQEQQVQELMLEKIYLENELIKAQIESEKAQPAIDAALVASKGRQVDGNIDRDEKRTQVELMKVAVGATKTAKEARKPATAGAKK